MMSLLLGVLLLYIACVPGEKLSGTLKTKVLEYHNDARRAVREGTARGYKNQLLPQAKSMDDLTWSDGLAGTANQWAKACGIVKGSKKPYCAHSGNYGWQPSPNFQSRGFRNGVGENQGCPSSWRSYPEDGEALLKSWLKTGMIDNELKMYKYAKFGNEMCPGGTKSPPWSSCGHYSQIIWANTKQVGCAMHQCTNGNKGAWMVCHYWPPGNYGGKWAQFPYEKASGSINPSPTKRPTQKPVTSGSDNCLEIGGFPPNLITMTGAKLSMMHGQWTQNADGNFVGARGGMLGYSSSSRKWMLMSNGNHFDVYGWCPKRDIFQCSGRWTYKRETNVGNIVDKTVGPSSFTRCGAIEISDFPCYDDYARRLSFRVNSSADSHHDFERVDLAGCDDESHVPLWAADRNDTSTLVLTRANSNDTEMGEWQIMDDQWYPFPKFACFQEDLNACGPGNWFQVRNDEVTGDTTIDGDESSDDNATANVGESAGYEVAYALLPEATIVSIVSAESNPGISASTIAAVVAIVLVVLALFVIGYIVVKKSMQRKALLQHVDVMVVEDDYEKLDS